MEKRKRGSTDVAVPLLSPGFIERRIYLIRKQKVMLDADLADLYGVPTKRLNEQVKRNKDRFPEDFMFQLTREEVDALNRSQIATGTQKHRDPRFPPYAFTEHGTVMLANVLKSHTAISASIQVVRAFVRLREILATHKDLAQKLEALEKKYDRQFKIVFDAIRQLMAPEEPPKQQRIGF
jgi:hypothetical protein